MYGTWCQADPGNAAGQHDTCVMPRYGQLTQGMFDWPQGFEQEEEMEPYPEPQLVHPGYIFR